MFNNFYVLRGRRGTSAVEYGILLGLLAMVAIVVLAQFGGRVDHALCKEVLSVSGSAAGDSSSTAACTDFRPTWNVSTTLPQGLAGVDYSATLPVATAPDGLPLTYSALALTAGVSFANSTRVASIGMPAANTYTIQAQAADTTGTVAQTFTFTIASGPTSLYGAVCSAENGTCSMIAGTHTLTYYCPTNTSLMSQHTVSGSVSCSNTTFSDPASGCVKTCAYH